MEQNFKMKYAKEEIVMRQAGALFLAVAFFVGCYESSLSGGIIGESCADNTDCISDLCILEFVDNTGEEPRAMEFVGGMCSASCDEPGKYEEFDICLHFKPTDESFLFNSCRNDLDCRTEDLYTCVFVGWDIYGKLAKACLPMSALK